MSFTSSFLPVALAGIVLALAPAAAQDKKAPGPNPVGAGAWSTQAKADPGGGIALDEKQTQAVKRVEAYFNELVNMRGNFVQTGADNKRMRGRFYVKKPGRFRFDYAPPSRQVIMSDGRFLRIYDLDLDKEDPFELDQTPFKILLKKDVDLLKDARINEVQEAEDVIVVSLQDRNPDAIGRIKLVLVKKPALELKEWVTTDAQGLDTRVELADINRTEDLDPALFRPLPFKPK